MEHPENSKEYKALTVNDGVAQPSIVNPYLNRSRFKRRELTVGDMVEGIVKGNVGFFPLQCFKNIAYLFKLVNVDCGGNNVFKGFLD